jgi:hypothetical protein
MSAFTDMVTTSMADAFTVFGVTSVTINAASYDAIFDEFAAERELELGGFVGTYAATALIQLAALSGVTAPIERTLEGKTLTVSGRTFRIDRVGLDEAGATLGLNNPNKRSK